jgi:hypothetical protein
MYPRNECVVPPEYLAGRTETIWAEAEKYRQLKEAGLIRKSWLSCQVCRSLWRLGRLLTTAGRRLERHYAPTALNPA